MTDMTMSEPSLSASNSAVPKSTKTSTRDGSEEPNISDGTVMRSVASSSADTSRSSEPVASSTAPLTSTPAPE